MISIHQKNLNRCMLHQRNFTQLIPHTRRPSKYVSPSTSFRHTTIRRNHNNKDSPTILDRLRPLRSNGTPEILIGSTILLLAFTDYTLQQRNEDDKKAMMRSLQRQVNSDAEVSRREVDEKVTSGEHLFKCVVRRVPPYFDGHKCLTNVKIGDVLNVLEEGVGPGNQYNLCSIDRGDSVGVSVGWFPCSCLEVMKD